MNFIEKYRTHIMICIIALGFGFFGGWVLCGYENRDVIKTGEEFALFSECRRIVEADGYKDFNENDALETALNSYLEKGVDKYTRYVSSVGIEQIIEGVNMSGVAVASGFQVGCSADGYILLTEVTEGKPAYEQGLRCGDVILEINGADVGKEGFSNAAPRLKGKDGTVISFLIQRGEQELCIDFIRSNVILKNVEWQMVGDVGYIAVESIDWFSDGYLSVAINELESANSFILDLRNNLGGVTDAGVNIADNFCGKNTVRQMCFNGVEMAVLRTDEARVDKPVVVLINGKTASAAEIITALMKQSGYDVTLVGERTFGKGIFQRPANVSDGGTLWYTAGTYTVGDWECYHGVGIPPDIEVVMDSEMIGTDRDIQMQKALDILRAK